MSLTGPSSARKSSSADASAAPSGPSGMRDESTSKSSGRSGGSAARGRGGSASRRPARQARDVDPLAPGSPSLRAAATPLQQLQRATSDGGQATEAQLVAAIEWLIEGRRHDEAIALFERAREREAGLPLVSVDVWAAFVAGLARHPAAAGHAERYGTEALAIYRRAMTAPLYAAVIAAKCYSPRALMRAQKLFEDAVSRGLASEAAARPMLAMYARLGYMDELAAQLNVCLFAGVPLGADSFAAVLSALADRVPPDWAAGQRVWERASALPPAERLPRLWNAYMKLCLAGLQQALESLGGDLDAAGLPRTASGLARLFQKLMRDDGHAFDGGSYLTLIRHLEAAGQPAVATDWLHEARSTVSLRGAAYDPAFVAVARAADAARLRQLLAMMENDGLEPSLKQRALAVRCLDLAGRLDEADAHADAMLAGSPALNSRELSILFDHFGVRGGPGGRAGVQALLGDLLAGRRGGRKAANANVLCSAVESLGRCGDPAAALRVVTETMPELKLQLDAKVLTSLFQGYAAAGQLAEGVRQVLALLGQRPGGGAPPQLDAQFWETLAARVAQWTLRSARDAAEQREAARLLAGVLPPEGGPPAAAAVRGLARAGPLLAGDVGVV